MMLKLDRGLFALLSVASALSLGACRGDDSASSSDSATSTGGTDDTNASSSGVPTTTVGSTTAVDDSTTSGDVPTTADSMAFIGTNTTGDPPKKPNGSMCASDDECLSMNCFSLGGGMLTLCADCNEDADCTDAGTGTACTLDIAGGNATCTMGDGGSTCMSDAACAKGFTCEAVLDVPIPGLIPNICSDCGESADCMNMQLCTPSFDLMQLSGQKSCVDPGSVMNNNLCPKGPDGALVCMSSHCTPAKLFGLIDVFICGECTDDIDCDMGQTCKPAEASMMGFSGTVCV